MIYVDGLQTYPNAASRLRRWKWSHLWSSENDPVEVLAFAKEIGLDLAWFQDRSHFPHFDVTPVYRRRAIKAGAQEKSLREWLVEQRRALAWPEVRA